MELWSTVEWEFCLYCFYHAPNIDTAVKDFQKKYTRSRLSIVSRFKREGIRYGEYVGSGLAKKISKSFIVNELKRAYAHFRKPFTADEFGGMSHVSMEDVIGHFGSWLSALQAAGLQAKFEVCEKVSQEKRAFSPEKEVQAAWKKEKEDILQKVEGKKIAWLKSQANKRDLINEMILEAVAKADAVIIEPSPIRIKKSPSKSNCTIWLEISDLQLGTLVTSEEMGGINAHNWLIWQEKLKIWKTQVIQKIEHYAKMYTIDRVIMAFLGDMVEGANIFRGQAWKVDANVVDQAINGANDTSGAVLEIISTFPDLHFDILEVFGNHGRIGDKGENPYSCSMDKVFQRFLESQIAKANLPNYTFHRNDAWFYFLEIYGWNHLLLHGDQGMSKLWSNRPTVNSLEKGMIRYCQMFQDQVHFLHAGHFHSDLQMSFNLSQMLINGSWIGTSNFAATAMVASSPPVQVMHVFEPRVGLSATERIYLVEDQVKKPIRPKSL